MDYLQRVNTAKEAEIEQSKKLVEERVAMLEARQRQSNARDASGGEEGGGVFCGRSTYGNFMFRLCKRSYDAVACINGCHLLNSGRVKEGQ